VSVEYVKLIEKLNSSEVEEDVRKGVNLAMTTKDLGAAKTEIKKDVNPDQVQLAHDYVQEILKMLEDGKVKNHEFAKKLIEILKKFFNDNEAIVGKQASYDVAADAKTKKGFKGFKTKSV